MTNLSFGRSLTPDWVYQQVKDNKKEAMDLAQRSGDIIDLLCDITENLDDPSQIPQDLLNSIEHFAS